MEVIDETARCIPQWILFIGYFSRGAVDGWFDHGATSRIVGAILIWSGRRTCIEILPVRFTILHIGIEDEIGIEVWCAIRIFFVARPGDARTARQFRIAQASIVTWAAAV